MKKISLNFVNLLSASKDDFLQHRQQHNRITPVPNTGMCDNFYLEISTYIIPTYTFLASIWTRIFSEWLILFIAFLLECAPLPWWTEQSGSSLKFPTAFRSHLTADFYICKCVKKLGQLRWCLPCDPTPVWPGKNRQMSIKVAQKWFH